MGVATAIALLGWGLAHYLYAVRAEAAPELAESISRYLQDPVTQILRG